MTAIDTCRLLALVVVPAMLLALVALPVPLLADRLPDPLATPYREREKSVTIERVGHDTGPARGAQPDRRSGEHRT